MSRKNIGVINSSLKPNANQTKKHYGKYGINLHKLIVV